MALVPERKERSNDSVSQLRVFCLLAARPRCDAIPSLLFCFPFPLVAAAMRAVTIPAEEQAAIKLAAQLNKHGFVGSSERVLHIARFCIWNDIASISDFIGLPNPRDIKGFGEYLTDAECSFLLSLGLGVEKRALRREPPEIPAKHQTQTSKGSSITEVIKRGTERTEPLHYGPMRSLKSARIGELTAEQRTQWLESARIAAVLGSAPKTFKFALCGIRCWLAFADEALGKRDKEFPPTVDDLIAWSALFRSEGTWSNYLNAVKLACELKGVSLSVFQHPSVQRAKRAIGKRGCRSQRAKLSCAGWTWRSWSRTLSTNVPSPRV